MRSAHSGVWATKGLSSGLHTRQKRRRFVKACPTLDRLSHVVPGSRTGLRLGLGLYTVLRDEFATVNTPLVQDVD